MVIISDSIMKAKYVSFRTDFIIECAVVIFIMIPLLFHNIDLKYKNSNYISAINISIALNFGFEFRYWFAQKQPPEVFCKKGVIRNFKNSQENTSDRILKKRLWHRCFPMNFAKSLRTPFLQNVSRRLLLIG